MGKIDVCIEADADVRRDQQAKQSQRGRIHTELLGGQQNGFGSDSLRCQIHQCFSCVAHVHMGSHEMLCCPQILNERMQLVADDLRLLMVLCLDPEDTFALHLTTK